MAKLIHESPLGDLEIPTVLGTVPAGVPFDVDADIAQSLLEQGDLFRKATKAEVTAAEKAAKAAADEAAAASTEEVQA